MSRQPRRGSARRSSGMSVHNLGNRMLDLDAGIHFNEMDPPVSSNRCTRQPFVGPGSSASCWRLGQTTRSGMVNVGKLGADDSPPFAEQRRGGEAPRARQRIEHPGDIGAHGPRAACRLSPGLSVVCRPWRFRWWASRAPLASFGRAYTMLGGGGMRSSTLCRGARPEETTIGRVSIAGAMLAWYDRERRRLPWRAEPGEDARSVPRLAQRDHAAADHGQGGAAAL